jgi:hypothetical protein
VFSQQRNSQLQRKNKVSEATNKQITEVHEERQIQYKRAKQL